MLFIIYHQICQIYEYDIVEKFFRMNNIISLIFERGKFNFLFLFFLTNQEFQFRRLFYLRSFITQVCKIYIFFANYRRILYLIDSFSSELSKLYIFRRVSPRGESFKNFAWFRINHQVEKYSIKGVESLLLEKLAIFLPF